MIPALIKQNFYLIATALSVAIVFLMFLVRRRQRSSFVKQLSRLVTVIFSCLLMPEYPDNLYLFERRVHKQKMKCLRQLQRRDIQRVTAATRDAPGSSGNRFIKLFEIVIDLGQIRRRVTDHTVFALCEKELALLQDAMVELIHSTSHAQGYEPKYAAFSQSINQFEDVYEHVVKVAAREPVAFILFISSLRELQKILQIPNSDIDITTSELMP